MVRPTPDVLRDLAKHPFVIMADIHADIGALRKVLVACPDAARHRIFLGDLIGYGDFPAECVNTARDQFSFMLKGNHEEGLFNDSFRDDNFNPRARETVLKHRELLNDEQKQFLKGFVGPVKVGPVYFSHGAPTGPLTDYVASKMDAIRIFEKYPDLRLMFCAHVHRPGLYELRGGQTIAHEIPSKKGIHMFDLHKDSRYIILCPSVTPGRDEYTRPGMIMYNHPLKMLNFIFTA